MTSAVGGVVDSGLFSRSVSSVQYCDDPSVRGNLYCIMMYHAPTQHEHQHNQLHTTILIAIIYTKTSTFTLTITYIIVLSIYLSIYQSLILLLSTICYLPIYQHRVSVHRPQSIRPYPTESIDQLDRGIGRCPFGVRCYRS